MAKFIKEDLKLDSPYGIRLIQGSQLIVPKLYEGAHAHILQNEDQRIVFTIPYLNDLTIIGTTDREYTGDPAKVAITEGETDYMLKVVNAHFKKQLSRDDIVHTYSACAHCNDESDNPHHPRLHLVAFRHRGRGADPVGVRRQADHLPQARRVGHGTVGAPLPGCVPAGPPPPACPAAKT